MKITTTVKVSIDYHKQNSVISNGADKSRLFFLKS